MEGQLALTQLIGVRFPGPDPTMATPPSLIIENQTRPGGLRGSSLEIQETKRLAGMYGGRAASLQCSMKVMRPAVNRKEVGSIPAAAATPVRSGNNAVSYSAKDGSTPLAGSNVPVF